MQTVGVPPNWPHHYAVDTFEAHWNKNSNPAWAFDQWFLNLFPQGKPFLFNGGGYATLSFLPTLGTMILGLIAGGKLKALQAKPASSLPTAQPAPSAPAGASSMVWLIVVGALLMIAALGVDALHLGPIVKRIWTPTWTLYSGAWCYWILAGLYFVVDYLGWKAWTYPLRVIGANSIVAYVMAELAGHWLHDGYQWLTGRKELPAQELFFLGVGILVFYWLVLFAMYRLKWHVRI
jgi:predicted acyltransferase